MIITDYTEYYNLIDKLEEETKDLKSPMMTDDIQDLLPFEDYYSIMDRANEEIILDRFQH